MNSQAAAPTIDLPRRSATTARDPGWHRWFEESEDAQLVCTCRGEIVAANRKAAQLLLLNQTAAETPPLVFQFLPSAAGGRLAGWLRPGLKQPQAMDAVTLVCDGQPRHLVDVRATPLDEGFSLLTLRDASRRWRMESHVQRLLTAVDATPDVVFLADVQRRLTFVNTSFQTVTGYTIEDALGKTADFLRAPNQENKILEYLHLTVPFSRRSHAW